MVYLYTITKLRNYQVLTLIGAIIGMLAGFGALATLGTLDSMHGAFDEFTNEYGDSSDRQQYAEGRQLFEQAMLYTGSAVATVVIANIIALTLVFVMTRTNGQVKIVGAILIVISIVNIIAIGYFGVVSFALLLPAGIVALRYKVQRTVNTLSTQQPHAIEGSPF
jgi:hypothetical protein